MRYSLVSVLALASTVAAHAQVYGVWINGKDQGDGRSKYIRSPASNSPVKDLTSPNIVCNVNGGKAVSSFVSAAAGDKVTFEWYHDNRGDDIIASSHKGPIITYVAKYTTGDGTGAIWTKIAEQGYDGSQWAVDKLIANKGKADFTLPSGLAAGKYLVRQEIIGLHEADAAYNKNSARGAQFYPSCAQFEVTGSGSAVPSENFDFNKGYTYSDPGIVFNLYGSFTSYSIPGPKVWAGTSSSSSNSGSNSGSGSSSTPVATTAAAASSAAATSALAQVTQPALSSTPKPSFSTIVTSAAATKVQSEAPAATTAKSGGKTGCKARRRARRSAQKFDMEQ